MNKIFNFYEIETKPSSIALNIAKIGIILIAFIFLFHSIGIIILPTTLPTIVSNELTYIFDYVGALSLIISIILFIYVKKIAMAICPTYLTIKKKDNLN